MKADKANNNPFWTFTYGFGVIIMVAVFTVGLLYPVLVLLSRLF